jgi:hypothetical protein
MAAGAAGAERISGKRIQKQHERETLEGAPLKSEGPERSPPTDTGTLLRLHRSCSRSAYIQTTTHKTPRSDSVLALTYE